MQRSLITAAILLASAGLAQAQYAPSYGYGYAPRVMSQPVPTLPQQRPQPMAAPALAPAPEQAEETAADAPDALLREGMGALLAFVGGEDKPDLEQLAAFLEAQIAPYFDFGYMAQMAAGPLYRKMSEEQRTRLTDKLKTDFLMTMTEKLGGLSGQSVRYLGSRLGQNGTTAMSSVGILNPAGFPAKLDFRLYQSDDGWKVYDVAANGRSAVVHYRQAFRSILRGMTAPRGYGAAPMRGYR